MSLEYYLQSQPRGSSTKWNAETIRDFAQEVLSHLEHLPPGASEPPTADSSATCVLTTVGGPFWGIYAAGATRMTPGDPVGFRPQLILDPAWLDRDFRATDTPDHSLIAAEAGWATRTLNRVFGLEIPNDTILTASLAPRPHIIAAGDSITAPMSGTLGPPVTYTDPSTGRPTQGFLTAGHTVETAKGASFATQVTIDTAGIADSAAVATATVPNTLGNGLAKNLSGAVDGAIIGPQTVTTGLGPAGAAGHLAHVQRIGGSAGGSGQVVGFAVWVARTSSAWCDCYVVAGHGGRFSKMGDSGAAVTSGARVIGLLVGGARAVPGCSATVSYVQDIAALTFHLNCTLVD